MDTVKNMVIFDEELKAKVLEKDSTVKTWKFAQTRNPNIQAFWSYSQGDIDRIIRVLEGFRMKVRPIEDNLYLVEDFIFDNCGGSTGNYFITKVHESELKALNLDWDVFIHENNKMILFDWDAEFKKYYSNELNRQKIRTINARI